VAPESQTLLLHAAERRNNLGTVTAALLRLLERYGAAELTLDHRRELRNEAPPVAVTLQGARCPRAAASPRTL
jgi:hypothetical protein